MSDNIITVDAPSKSTDMDRVIKITEDGPYIVHGGVPIYEKEISREDGLQVWKDGRDLPQGETYALCRCGRSNKAPFCDGQSHKRFKGEETADRAPFCDRADAIEGPGIDLMDDMRCSLSRFCHRREGSAWKLMADSDDPQVRNEIIRAACECPSGRIVAVGKDGQIHEDQLEQAIYIVQDPAKGVSSGIYVMGGIPVESADGERYEVRNRVMLCRCGGSRNKPFCDATHVPRKYKDTRGGSFFGRKD